MAQIAAFGSRSHVRVTVTRSGATLTALTLAFRPSIDQSRRILFGFTDGANAYDVEIIFTDTAFEETTVLGKKKSED